jgi:hypothetical protein
MARVTDETKSPAGLGRCIGGARKGADPMITSAGFNVKLGMVVPREYDGGRAERLQKGLEALHNPDGLPETFLTEGRLEHHLARLHDGYARCCSLAWFEPWEHMVGSVMLGREWKATANPCHQRGCERCSVVHAGRELKRWEAAFHLAYPAAEPLVVLKLRTPGWGPRQARRAVGLFLKRRPIRALLENTVGFLYPEDARGYVFHIVLRRTALQQVATIFRHWRAVVPGGWVGTEPVDACAPAISVALELRCRADQALLLLAADGEAAQARRWYEEELGADDGKAVHHMVFGPGFRGMAKGEDLAQAVGAEFSTIAPDERIGENSAAGEPDSPGAVGDGDGAVGGLVGGSEASPHGDEGGHRDEQPGTGQAPAATGLPCSLGHANCSIRPGTMRRRLLHGGNLRSRPTLAAWSGLRATMGTRSATGNRGSTAARNLSSPAVLGRAGSEAHGQGGRPGRCGPGCRRRAS